MTSTTFVLIHGAGGRASYWDLVRGELDRLGHRSIAMDLPSSRSHGSATTRQRSSNDVPDDVLSSLLPPRDQTDGILT